MTAAPEQIPVTSLKEEKKEEKHISSEIHPLESIFYLGYAESPILTLFQEGSIELKVKFRTLTPDEMRDVSELTYRFESPDAKSLTEKVETLARSIVSINYMPLILTTKEQDEFKEKNGRHPTPLEMARDILHNKIKSLVIIATLYEAYVKFSNEVFTKIEKSKKKLNNSLLSS